MDDRDVAHSHSKREVARSYALRESEVMRHTIEMALAGVDQHPSQSAPIGKGCVVLGRSHGRSGYPSRFRYGVVTLQVDEAWRERMSRHDRFTVTTIGLPLLLRYGWRPLGRSSPRAGDK